jgi:HSP20 family protein
MITRWPFVDTQHEINRLQNEMTRWLGRNGNNASVSSRSYPPMNMWEDGDGFVVEAEMPGMDLDNIEIFVDGGDQLTVKGERKSPLHETGTWHRQERGFGSFKRTITLPADVDSERVEAVLKNGVLTISLPKPEEVKPRKIKVKAQ